MKIKKTTLSQIFFVLMILFFVAYLYSPRMKSWLIEGFMMVGFFKPDIHEAKSGEKLYPAPPMVVEGVNAAKIDLQQQKGKVVFINFWATWCPPCLAELSSINDFYLKVKDNPNIVFISVDVDNNLQKSVPFVAQKGYSLPVYVTDMKVLPPPFYSGTIPTTLVINKDGFVVFNHVNRANYDDEKFAEYVIGLTKE